MSKKKVYCGTSGCFEERVYVGAGLCAACYQGLRYWTGRTPTEIVQRMKQLDRLQGRMETMSPHVRTIRGRRVRRTA